MTTILVSHSDSALNQALSSMLRDNGYKVESCPDGEKAWKSLEEFPFDLALIDLHLAYVNGMELLRKAKTSQLKTKMIIMSHTSYEDVVVEAFTLGADEFVSLPFSVKELLARIQKCLRTTAHKGG